MTRKLALLASLSMIVALLGVASADAQGRPSGIRVTVTNIDTATSTVDFDITLNTATTRPGTTMGLIGDYFMTPYYGFTHTGYLLTPAQTAILYGDGATLKRDRIPMVGPGVYRGSFSHVYPGPGNYDLRVAASGVVGLATTAPALTTGNPVSYVNPVYQGFDAAGNYLGPYYIAGTYIIGLTNNPGANQPYATTSGNGFLVVPATGPPPPPPEEIPTATELGMVLLGLLLASAGIVFLRRQ